MRNSTTYFRDPENHLDDLTKINALRALGREDDAKNMILAAFRRAGNKRDAAAALGCNPATLYRLITSMNLWDALDDVAAAKGWKMRAGRARGTLTSLVVLAAAVVGLTACATDVGATEPVNPPAYDDAAAGAPAPLATPDAAVDDTAPATPAVVVDASALPAAGGPAPTMPVERVDAGTPAPAVDASAPQTMPMAGSAAPVIVVDAGAPAPPPHPTSCKLTNGQRVDCSAASQRTWVNTSVWWWFADGKSIANCNSTDAPQCTPGAQCNQLNVITSTTIAGVCE